MRGARLLLAVLAAFAVGACARQQPTYYVVDPNTGQPVPVVTQQQQFAPPEYAQQGYAQPAQSVQPPQYAQQTYVPPSYQQPVQQPAAQPQAPSTGERGLFNSRRSAPQVYTQPYVQQPYAQQPLAQPQMALRKADLMSRRLTATPRRPPMINKPTRSIPATGCASWCSARTASPTATPSMPAATSTCRWSAPCRRAATAPSSSRR